MRIRSLDLARGFTVFFIPAIHSVMLYSRHSVRETEFGKWLAFVAEWPGAQLLMLLMGVSFALGKKRNFKSVLIRSSVLLLAGYLLNAIKFLVPYFSTGIDQNLINDIGADGWKSFLLVGDIFHFAAFALIILYFLNRLNWNPNSVMLVAVAICFISPFLWDIHCTNVIADHLLHLFAGQPPEVYFPLLPWLVYPITGLAIGYCMKVSNFFTHIELFIIGCGLLLFSLSIRNDPVSTSFYRTEPWDTLRHLGFVMLWLVLWYWAEKFIEHNLFFQFLMWCSKRITLVYLIQWPFIFWMLPWIGYQQLDFLSSFVIATLISMMVFLLSYIIYELRKSI